MCVKNDAERGWMLENVFFMAPCRKACLRFLWYNVARETKGA